MSRRVIALLALLGAAPLPAAEPGAADAEAELRLDTSTVTGNRELPRVMAIVPWKKAPPGEPPGRPGKSLLDEALEPVDRLVLRREAAYWQAAADTLEPSMDAPAGTPAGPQVEEE